MQAPSCQQPKGVMPDVKCFIFKHYTVLLLTQSDSVFKWRDFKLVQCKTIIYFVNYIAYKKEKAVLSKLDEQSKAIIAGLRV